MFLVLGRIDQCVRLNFWYLISTQARNHSLSRRVHLLGKDLLHRQANNLWEMLAALVLEFIVALSKKKHTVLIKIPHIEAKRINDLMPL